MGSSQQFSLRWNNYLRHITGAFDSLRSDEDLVDVTLSCEGKKIRAHKMLLSACSSYFRDLFKENPCQHPVIIFRDVKYQDLEALVDFMYQGEVNVVQDQLSSFLNTAELLAVQGLTDGSGKDEESDISVKKTSEDTEPTAAQPEVKRLPPSVAAVVAASASVTSPIVNNKGGCGPGSPVAKKRKCGSGVSAVAGINNIISKEDNHLSDVDSMEMIPPVLPNVKVEQPDYYEHERVGPYSEFVKDQSVISGNVDSVTKEEKKDSVEFYSSNSSDKIQLGNPLLDINQVMGASGPSLDTLPQEPLQDNIVEDANKGTLESDMSIIVSSTCDEDPQKCITVGVDNECTGIIELKGNDTNSEVHDCGIKSEDPYYGCDVCREAKALKKDSGCPRCPICPNLSAPCSHLLKLHMRDFHGWFTVQRRYNMY